MVDKDIEINEQKSKKFPLGDFWLFIGSAIIVGVISTWYESTTVDSEMESHIGVIIIASIFVMIITLISIGFQFLITRYPASWIAKQKNVYTRDMWQALFYSSMIVLWLGLVTEPMGLISDTMHSSISNVISTVAFLLFYLNGQEKESKVKRAVIIISVVWLILSLILVNVGSVLPDPVV